MKFIPVDYLVDDVKRAVKTIVETFGDDPLAMEGAEAMSAVAARAKAMDGIDIVFCCECKHFDNGKCAIDAAELVGIERSNLMDNDFCSYGDKGEIDET